MSTAVFSKFFALLSLACWAATAGVVALAVSARARSRLGEHARAIYADVRRLGLWLAWLVATVTTAGSLYFSEVAHYTPCKLCWYQRIAIYPLSIVLFVAAKRRDRAVAWYVVPVATVGALFAAYQSQLQAFPNQHSSFCTTLEPCTARYVWEFGFVSLPLMALSAFAFILTMVIVVARAETTEESS